MNGQLRAKRRLRALLPALMALSCVARAGDEPATGNPSPVSREAYQQAQAYEKAITELEARQGAYGAGLAEPLAGLALSLQAQGRHEDAVSLFRRSAHLSRVNEGLNTPAQLPQLQGEITSLMALRRFEQVDEREAYLFGLQQRSLGAGADLTDAYLEQAAWQQQAYLLGLEQEGFPRLMNMWELYRQALNGIIEREGEQSPALREPLEGMLRTQYLIADYEIEIDPMFVEDDFRRRQQLQHFAIYQARSYEKGIAVLETMQRLPAPAKGADNTPARVLEGDWHMLHNRRDAAREAYAAALAELGDGDAAQAEVRRLFGEPVPLPDLDGLRPLATVPEPGAGDVVLQYRVDERGRAVDITRLDDNEEIDGAAHRLMRTLRKTRFRPQLIDGQPGETDILVKAYRLP